MAWEPARYLRFEEERSRPCRDLVARIQLPAAARLADLGCGPGNSTAILRARWPEATCVGVDSSEEMLATARRTDPTVRWVRDDIRSWSPAELFDLVFSNAALQWLDDHATLLPRLFGRLRSPGALAFQMPANEDAPYQRAFEELTHRAAWKDVGSADEGSGGARSPEFYYDLLAGAARSVDLWDTEYAHVLPDPAAIVDWTRGTALRPWLARLADPARRERFLKEYEAAIARAYPRRTDGRVLFPFRRRFVIAYR